ncbi:MAG TPA: penicillin-binding protein 1C [bacterium]|nr:penicillin-binding protein 1C [bacterium]
MRKIIKKMLKRLSRHHRLCLPAVFFLAGLVWLLRPMACPFRGDTATVVFDRHGDLLRIFLPRDEQLRFPAEDMPLPDKYLRALREWEDRRFFSHPGVDIRALAGALITNIRAGRIVRGGSTITMQVARLADPKPRTVWNKIRETAAALRLSVHFNKSEILRMYTSNVPMGGNVVGIQAASYRYYGRPVTELTWAESALFVILPNAPSLINLDQGRDLLLIRRNRLLERLRDTGVLDSVSCMIARDEPLPEGGNRLPFLAPHATLRASRLSDQRSLRTTLDRALQARVESLIRPVSRDLRERGIFNMAVLAVETRTGRVRAYVGSESFFDDQYSGQVDGVQAPRSTGSLLKPFLAALCLDRGPYTLRSVIQDVPTFYGTFAPQNAGKSFRGLVTLEEMLLHSLNVPAVRLLNEYGLHDFHAALKQNGLNYLFRSADGYGLSLILGGAEASLWELTGLYLGLGNLGKRIPLTLFGDDDITPGPERICGEGAAWLVLNALTRLARPGVEYYWRQFGGRVPVAWKTGTSYGQKDGWAVGVNRQWTIGVWAGNFTGEGNAEIGGANSAAPLLFMLFNQLTDPSEPVWFEEPLHDLAEIPCCTESGYPAGPYCPGTVIDMRPVCAWRAGVCRFHRRYVLDRKTGRSVCSLCWTGVDTVRAIRYIVPAQARDILGRAGRRMDAIPLHADRCPVTNDPDRLALIYPVNDLRILIPRDLDGRHQRIVFQARHQHPDAVLFWILDGTIIGEPRHRHELAVDLFPGVHRLTVQDTEGFSRTIRFTAYRRESGGS